MMNDPRPLFIKCRREFFAANHILDRIVDQVVAKQFLQVRHGDHDSGAKSLVIEIVQE